MQIARALAQRTVCTTTHTRVHTAAPPRFRRARLACRASLGELADTAVTYGALAASVGATVLAVFTVKAPKRRRPPAKGQAPPIEEDGGFRWAVMGVVSCLPLFNWLAWVFAALDDEDGKARLYYWFAALYALPLLRSGFDFDWFTIAMLVTGIAHVQAERIAATDPDLQSDLARQLRPLAVVRTLASATATAASAAFGIGGKQQQQQQQQGARGGDRRQLPSGEDRWWWEEADGSRSDAEEYELRRFDQELRDREQRRKRR